MTTKITPTQENILKAAADREDGDIHPLPKNIKGGAEKKVIGSLMSKGLAEHPDGDENLPLRITDVGRIAIGLDPRNTEPADDAFEEDVTEAEQALSIAPADNEPETPTEADDTLTEERDAETNTPANEEPPTETDPASEEEPPIAANEEPPAREEKKAPKEPRPGTKKARMFEMLRRDEGATTKQIMDETKWSNHTVRGAIALAKRAGWNITTNKNRVVGPNQVGSPGSFTTYFLTANA